MWLTNKIHVWSALASSALQTSEELKKTTVRFFFKNATYVILPISV